MSSYISIIYQKRLKPKKKLGQFSDYSTNSLYISENLNFLSNFYQDHAMIIISEPMIIISEQGNAIAIA